MQADKLVFQEPFTFWKYTSIYVKTKAGVKYRVELEKYTRQLGKQGINGGAIYRLRVIKGIQYDLKKVVASYYCGRWDVPPKECVAKAIVQTVIEQYNTIEARLSATPAAAEIDNKEERRSMSD